MSRTIACIFSLALAVLAGPASAADAPEWDQKKVTSLVKDLGAVVGQIRLTEGRVDDPELAKARAQVGEELKLLKHNLRYLGKLLSQGEDRKGSWPFAKYCAQLIKRVRRTAAEVPVLPEQGPNVEKAEALIAEIGTYYGVAPLDVAAPPSD